MVVSGAGTRWAGKRSKADTSGEPGVYFAVRAGGVLINEEDII
jgi:hypothetical protein